MGQAIVGQRRGRKRPQQRTGWLSPGFAVYGALLAMLATALLRQVGTPLPGTPLPGTPLPGTHELAGPAHRRQTASTSKSTSYARSRQMALARALASRAGYEAALRPDSSSVASQPAPPKLTAPFAGPPHEGLPAAAGSSPLPAIPVSPGSKAFDPLAAIPDDRNGIANGYGENDQRAALAGDTIPLPARNPTRGSRALRWRQAHKSASGVTMTATVTTAAARTRRNVTSKTAAAMALSQQFHATNNNSSSSSSKTGSKPIIVIAVRPAPLAALPPLPVQRRLASATAPAITMAKTGVNQSSNFVDARPLRHDHKTSGPGAPAAMPPKEASPGKEASPRKVDTRAIPRAQDATGKATGQSTRTAARTVARQATSKRHDAPTSAVKRNSGTGKPSAGKPRAGKPWTNTAILVPAPAPRAAASAAAKSHSGHKPGKNRNARPAIKTPDQWPPAAIQQALARCHSLLAGTGATAKALPPLKHGACGTPAPIKLSSIGANPAVQISPPATVNCAYAAALHKWIETKLQPTALKLLGAKVTKIHNMASYACRNRYGRKTGKLSEHAKANALDIGGFTLANGKRVSVLASWGATEADMARAERRAAERWAAERWALEKAKARAAKNRTPAAAGKAAAGRSATSQIASAAAANPQKAVARRSFVRNNLPEKTALGRSPERHQTTFQRRKNRKRRGHLVQKNDQHAPAETKFLHRVHAKACGIFGTVLGPEANNAHRNHFHFDLIKRRHRAFCE